jgi:hypothetical protein
MVYAPNKMMTPVNSFQYNELITDGYLYDEKENLLVYPTIHSFEKEVSYPIGHNDISSEHLDGITTLTLEYDDNDNLITHEINEKDYNIQILVKNYRQFNEKFQKKLNKLRLTGEFKFNKTVDPKTAINEKFTILTSTHKIIDKMNSLGLMLNENVYIDGLKVNSPMRFYKTKKDYFNAGEFGTIIDIKITGFEKSINSHFYTIFYYHIVCDCDIYKS